MYEKHVTMIHQVGLYPMFKKIKACNSMSFQCQCWNSCFKKLILILLAVNTIFDFLTHWGQVTSMNCVINGSRNGLLLNGYQAITWTIADFTSMKPLGTNFCEVWIKTSKFSISKMPLNMSPVDILFKSQCVNSWYIPWLSQFLTSIYISIFYALAPDMPDQLARVKRWFERSRIPDYAARLQRFLCDHYVIATVIIVLTVVFFVWTEYCIEIYVYFVWQILVELYGEGVFSRRAEWTL